VSGVRRLRVVDEEYRAELAEAELACVNPPPRYPRGALHIPGEVARFLAERTTPGRGARSAELYGAWRQWCDAERFWAGSHKAFSMAVERAGHKKARDQRGVYWADLELREAA
jgi:hypothetical protein